MSDIPLDDTRLPRMPLSMQEVKVRVKIPDAAVPEMTRFEIFNALIALEDKYNIGSASFYALYVLGESPIDGIDKMRWAAYWEAWSKQTKSLASISDAALAIPGLIMNYLCPASRHVQVKGPYDLNFRTGPGRQHDDLADLHPDTVLQVLAESNNGEWLMVRVKGWVKADLVKDV